MERVGDVWMNKQGLVCQSMAVSNVPSWSRESATKAAAGDFTPQSSAHSFEYLAVLNTSQDDTLLAQLLAI